MLSWLYTTLFKPHPSLNDPYDRRVATLLSIHHFLALPLGPKHDRSYTQPDDALHCGQRCFLGAISYAPARSQWYKIGIVFVIVALLIPL